MAIEVEKITKVHTEVYEWPRHDTHTHKKGLLCHINCDETVFVSHWSWFFFRLFVKANRISMQNFISSVQMAPSMGQRLMFFFTIPIRWSFDVWLDSFCSLPYKFWGFRFIFLLNNTNYSVMLMKMRAPQTKAQKCEQLFDRRNKLTNEML